MLVKAHEARRWWHRSDAVCAVVAVLVDTVFL